MQPLRALAAAAAAARQWLRSAASIWRLEHKRNAGSPEIPPSESQIRISTPLLHSPDESPHPDEESAPEAPATPDPTQSEARIPPPAPKITPTPPEAEPEEAEQDELGCLEAKISSAASKITCILRDSRLPITLPASLLLAHRRAVRSRVVGQVLQELSDPDIALRFFRWLPGDSRDAYAANSLLLTLVRAGRSSEAYELFRSGEISTPPDSGSVSTIVYGLTSSGQLQKALNFCDDIRHTGVSIYGTVLSTLIQSLCNSGNVEVGLKLAREFTRDSEEFIYTYSIVIHTLIKMRRIQPAWNLFFEVHRRGGTLSAHVYGILMSGLCKTGEISTACKLLEDMTSRGCKIDAVIFNTLILGFCRARRVDDAMELVRVMKSQGFSPCVVTYTTIIDGLVKTQEVERARAVLREMIDRGCSPNAVTFTAIIDGYCKAKRMEEAVGVVKEMMGSGCEPDLITYNSLIHGFCISRKVERAGWVLDELLERGFSPSVVTYNTLVIGHCRVNRPDRARALLREMILRGSLCHLVVYIDLLYILCEASCGTRVMDCCIGRKEVGELYELLEQLVDQSESPIVFEGESLYDPVSRLERVQQVLEYMHHRGCVGGDERFNKLQGALAMIKELKTPESTG